MKMKYFLALVMTPLVAILFLSTSCKKSLKDLESFNTSQMKSAAAMSLLATNLSVDWNNWTNGDNYNVAMAISDFGDINGFTHSEQARTLISLSRLRVTFLKNEYGAAGGVITNGHIDPSEGYELNYKVKFHADFDFAQNGGRVGWGLEIGDGAAGVADGEGGSFRIAWDTDASGNAYFKPYIYYADQPGSDGDDFDVRYPASGGIGGSVWYNIKMVFKANTKMNKNGRAELYINNVPVLNTSIRWTKDHLKRFADQLLFSNYRAGAGSESPVNANVWFDDFTLTGNNPTYPPTWCDSVYSVDSAFDASSNVKYWITEINNNPGIRIRNSLANSINGETVSQFARRMDCCVAINASMGRSGFPSGETHVSGLQIVDGVIVQEIPSANNFRLGIKSNNDLKSYPSTVSGTSILNDGAENAITGFKPWIENSFPSSVPVGGNDNIRNPRQVIGQLQNGNIIVFSCDGHRVPNSLDSGMLRSDVTRILMARGDVKFAFNLDGGGSVTTVLNGQRVTPLISPNLSGERPRPNFLYIKNQ